MDKAVGILELASVADGYLVANEIKKNTVTRLWLADPICPGRFLLIISGDVASIRAAMEMAQALVQDEILSEGMLASIHPGVLEALVSPKGLPVGKALGIVETLAIAPAILAADGAVKTAQVELIELRIAGGMGGKALVLFAGEVDAVKAALTKAQHLVEPTALASSVLVASPHLELLSQWQ
ncbi:MAG: BMC domain-containing protein [Firmicutes bacterium]|jgi:microcompartment protein CcmL/EutN|nr:BMC domain-containing protein [Bacillota bacterium]